MPGRIALPAWSTTARTSSSCSKTSATALSANGRRRNYQCAFPCIQSIRSKPTPECSSPLIEPLRPYFGNRRNGHNSSSGQDSNLQGGHNAKRGCCNEGGSDQRRDKHAGTAYSGIMGYRRKRSMAFWRRPDRRSRILIQKPPRSAAGRSRCRAARSLRRSTPSRSCLNRLEACSRAATAEGDLEWNVRCSI